MARRYVHGYPVSSASPYISKANQFARDVGGMDRDVIAYFFNLQEDQLSEVLDAYGKIYGESARKYAVRTVNEWRLHRTAMSGMVVERLFNLLPPRMPLQKKYQLAENIWNYYSPSSTHIVYTIGSQTNVKELANKINNSIIAGHSIPEGIKNRFKWLAAGDIQFEEKLLNHFVNQTKQLALNELIIKIPKLQKQLLDHPSTTFMLSAEITIKTHTVLIRLDKRLEDEIIDGYYSPRIESKNNNSTLTKYANNTWVWIIITFIGVVLSFFTNVFR